MRIATFNVNGLRARLPIVMDWLEKHGPVVLCLQETKVQDPEFPEEPFLRAGYHVVYRGKKGYEGVAIVSPERPEAVRFGFPAPAAKDETRLLCATFGGIPVINTYVPEGRSPASEWFQYKLYWYKRVRRLLEESFSPDQRLVWCGDLNVAPESIDVYDPERLLGRVDFHPDVHRAYREVLAWGLVDCFRLHHPESEQYTYYDYRIRNAVKKKLGWRIDHILATEPLARMCTDAYIDLEPRTRKRPSDHTPLVAEFVV
jgi:exodeoxyribonuclease-3